MSTIQVSHLGKAYKQYPSPWSRVAEWLSFSGKARHQAKWAVRNINFTVDAGECVGIIGTNGAGKSTLLKMVTGTTHPTTGKINIQGRVVALLELGMGFHPDFTGRQNVLMSGLLLGLTEAQLQELMPEIEAFAEIGEYIDQPVRVYSSGMQMRLAFSVATVSRPDILIVDEALSVGDAYFQHKSFDRIREFRELGTTLLLVSHDKGAIQSICDRAILLDKGLIAMEGRPEEVMDYYNAMIAERENQTVRRETTTEGQVQTISGTGEATIAEIALLNEQGEQIEIVDVGQKVTLAITAKVNQDLEELVLGYVIKDRLGQSVFGINTHRLQQTLEHVRQGELIDYQFEFDANLGEGSYSIAVALHTADTHLANNYEWRDLALVFNVVNVNKELFVGVAWMPPKLRCTRE